MQDNTHTTVPSSFYLPYRELVHRAALALKTPLKCVLQRLGAYHREPLRIKHPIWRRIQTTRQKQVLQSSHVQHLDSPSLLNVFLKPKQCGTRAEQNGSATDLQETCMNAEPAWDPPNRRTSSASQNQKKFKGCRHANNTHLNPQEPAEPAWSHAIRSITHNASCHAPTHGPALQRFPCTGEDI